MIVLIDYFLPYIQLIDFDPKALFASCIPEIIDLIGTRPKYGGTFKNERGRRQANTEWTSNRHFLFSIQKNAKKCAFFCQAVRHCLLIVQCKASQLRDFYSSAQSCLLEDAHNIFHNRKISYFCLKASTFLCLQIIYILYSANKSSDDFETSFSKPLD